MNREIISVLVDNKAGVLARVSGLFSRRAFNIESLAVGETENPAISRMTIMVTCDDNTLNQIVNQIRKLTCVHAVYVIDRGEAVSRETLLVKVIAPMERRAELFSLANVFNATIADVTGETMILNLSARPEDIASFQEVVEEYGVLEMVRTGAVSLQRGLQTVRETVNSED